MKSLKATFTQGLILCSILSTIIACEWIEIPNRHPIPYRGDIFNPNNHRQKPDSTTEKTILIDHLYQAWVSYPENYDWIRDAEHGTIECFLTMTCDEDTLIHSPIGPEYGISADASSHRIINGHLYTDCIVGNSTIISEDGQRLFSTPEREKVHSMLLYNNQLHTLSISQGQKSIIYRVDGQEVLRQDNSNIIRGLYLDNDHILFSYRLNVNPQKTEFHFVHDGIDQIILTPLTSEIVIDMLQCQGSRYILTNNTQSEDYYLYENDQRQSLILLKREKIQSAKLISYNKNILVMGQIYDGSYYSINIWNKTKLMFCLYNNSYLLKTFSQNNRLGLLYLENNQDEEDATIALLHIDYNPMTIPDIVIATDIPYYIDEKNLIIGVNRQDGLLPTLISTKTQQAKTEDFNGYYTALEIVTTEEKLSDQSD